MGADVLLLVRVVALLDGEARAAGVRVLEFAESVEMQRAPARFFLSFFSRLCKVLAVLCMYHNDVAAI